MNKKHLYWILPVCSFLLIVSMILMVPKQTQSAPTQVQQASEPIAQQPAPQTQMLVKEEAGNLVLYLNGKVVQRYNINTSLLPQVDREALASGIAVEDATALNKLLEDLGA